MSEIEMNQSVSTKKEEIALEIKRVISHFESDVMNSPKIADLSFWMGLLRRIMEWVQKSVKMKGLDKMEIAMDSIRHFASALINSNVGKIDEKALKTLKAVLSDEGLGLMGAATSVIKDFMRRIDTDGDGEISSAECASLFSCCFPKKANKK